MAERQEGIMREDGVGPEEVTRLAEKFMGELRDEGATLGEAKAVARRMAHILHMSERRSPGTPLDDIPIRDQ